MKSTYPIIFFLVLIIITIGAKTAKGQSLPALSESSKISLLTNSPWDKEVYALFGHTAIRINDPANYIDVAFNYGIFDFDSPNFMLRFIKGETDYFVGAIDFNNYLYEYRQRGVGVTEQILNLTQEEKQKIFEALVINSLPENREYRYNYFYDNCSTRPRDIIEKNINGTLEYKPTNQKQSYRDLIHQQVSRKSWIKFGIDLIIGADADKIITDKQKDFLPIYLENSFASAKIITNNDSIRNLVVTTNSILPNTSDSSTQARPVNMPLLVGIAILVIAILISVFFSSKKLFISKIFDFILFGIVGLGGCVIFFLMFFSEHPCTNPNWNIVWMNPLQIIFAALFCIKYLSKYFFYYHFINFVVLTLFLLAWFLIPQSLEIAFLPYILALWVRSGAIVLKYKSKKQLY